MLRDFLDLLIQDIKPSTRIDNTKHVEVIGHRRNGKNIEDNEERAESKKNDRRLGL